MENNIIVPTDDDIISEINDLPIQVKRAIAEAMRSQGEREVYYTPDMKKHTYMESLALMLWDAAVEGVVSFADGKKMDIKENPKAWTDIVKFIAVHMDGPVSANAQFNSVNVFKVYQGIDPSKL